VALQNRIPQHRIVNPSPIRSERSRAQVRQRLGIVRDLNVSNLAEALEEGAKFVFGDVSREFSNEDSDIVWISELVHWPRNLIIAYKKSTHGIHSNIIAITALLHTHAA
jgi:hypothetical protein